MNDIANTPEAVTDDVSSRPRPAHTRRVELFNDDYELALMPDLGGAVGRFTWRGRDVLRPARTNFDHPFDSASFPLAPYANRITNGLFRCEGREIRLESNCKPHPHPMHGQAWLAPWRVAEQTKNTSRLVFIHDIPDEWPWTYSVEQTLALSSDGLRIDLRITNLSQESMPTSYGFHPYFPKHSGARLRAAVRGVWLADENFVPTALTKGSHFLPLEKSVDLNAAPFVDHCHTGWRGFAEIKQPACGMIIDMQASSDLSFLHIYTPKNASFFCLEPVSAMPDAVNRPELDAITGLRKIAPGETASAYMTLSARVYNSND